MFLNKEFFLLVHSGTILALKLGVVPVGGTVLPWAWGFQVCSDDLFGFWRKHILHPAVSKGDRVEISGVRQSLRSPEILGL